MPPHTIFHLVEKSVWQNAKNDYTPATYKQDGFIHATAEPGLLLPVANHFYAEVPGAFLCLAIDSLRIGAEVRYESATPVGDKPAMTGDQLTAAAEQLFPHIYGPLPREAVMAELAVTRSEDGTFLAIEGAEARTA
ncbi:unnamed protein product [Phaeothamnion confervicola]